MAVDPVCGMTVDEKKGYSLLFEGRTVFFCSEHCRRKFASAHGIVIDSAPACMSCGPSPFYRNKSVIVSLVLSAALLLSFLFPILVPFRNTLLMYFRTIWWAVLLGFFLGGCIDYFIPREYISYFFVCGGKRSIINAVLLGFLMSACSHGILALAIQLHKKGAATPAVVAFLLASPWANITLTIMLVGFFGAAGVWLILSAVLIALTTGFIFQILERRGLIEKNRHSLELSAGFSVREDLRRRKKAFRFSRAALAAALKGVFGGAYALADMVLWWILIGMALAGAAGAYIPAGIFHSALGPSMGGLLLTLAAATVIEVCSEGSAPMAFELFRQTGALGNSFVFLMAGVVTDYTEIGLLWHNVGRRTALWLPLITVPQVILLGFIFNRIF